MTLLRVNARDGQRRSVDHGGLANVTDWALDWNDVPRAAVERLAADARKRLLVVKLRGGRTYNFTDAQGRAEPVLAFEKAFHAKTPPRSATVP